MQIKFNETGRSIVEILGVLAIIGILSIGGMAGYQYAYSSYQVGQIQDVVSKAKLLATQNNRSSHVKEVRRFVENMLSRYKLADSTPMVTHREGKYIVDLFKVSDSVCEKLQNKRDIFNSMQIGMTPEGCPTAEMNMQFTFDSIVIGGSGVNGSGDGYDNPIERCPDKMVWRQKEDGTYGCVCRHEYEYGEDCTRCEPPRTWNTSNQSCQCPSNKPIWENGTCKCIADTDCQYSGTGFCCDDTSQVCRPCAETDCDATKGLVLADGRCVCSGRKEWRQDEGESEPSCKCPLNTPAQANQNTCECPDGLDNVDEDGDGINECVISCPSDTGFTGLRNRTTGNCLCNTGAGYKAESEMVNGVQTCVCDSSRDYYQGPNGCLQCEAMTEKWCHRVIDGDENETRDWIGHDILCSAMDGTSWWCNAYTFETDESGVSRWSIYNPSSGTYCGPWKILKKSGNKFVCGTCDDLPLHHRRLQREGRTDEFGYCTCRGYYTYDKLTGECVRNACRASNQFYYSFIDKCLPCTNSAVYVNGICYNDAKYENCSLCYNGKAVNTDGSRNYFWHAWWKNTPDYCHANGNYEPSLKSKAEDRCSYEYGCMDKNIQKPYCDFNTKITTDCQCSTGGNVGEYCCSASTYPTAIGCVSCSAGQVPNSSRTGCTACPKNTITQDGKCVKCKNGYYPSSQQNRCLACPSDRTTDEDGLTCSVCVDSNKIFNMISNTCECPPEISFEDPVNGSCILFEEDVLEETEEASYEN